MKAAELRSQSKEELKTTLSERLRMLFRLRLIKGSGELTHTHLLRETRRTIAKIKTILAEKIKAEEEGTK